MSKRMTRVLSLILTLVMFVSVSTPAFAWGGGDLGSGWDRDIGEDEIRDFDEPVVEEEETLDYFHALDEDSMVEVMVEAPMGALPTLAELRAEPVEIEDVREAVESVVEGEANILLAMDISFWMNGIEIEPEEPVRVKISAPELENKTNLTLVHIPDADEPETIDLIDDEDLSFALGTNEIAFEADSFSVYAITWGEEESATVHWGELNGGTFTEFDSSKVVTLDTNASTISLKVDFEGFVYGGADWVSADRTEECPASATLKKVDGVWQVEKHILDENDRTTLTWADLANGDQIYVYYVAIPEDADPTPSGADDDSVPTPDTRKSVSVNEDGTRTITIDVTGTKVTEDNSFGANVLVVLDRTYSMSGTDVSGTTKSRWQVAQDAVGILVDALDWQKNDIEFALVPFSSTNGSSIVQWSGSDWTSNGDTFKTYVNNLNHKGLWDSHGTNWQDGLDKAKTAVDAKTDDSDTIYVIFVTDGEPNQPNNGAAAAALTSALALTRVSKVRLYGVFCGADSGFSTLNDLITQGGGVTPTINGTSASAIEEAFQGIAQTILNDLYANDVSVDDGIPSLSSVSSGVVEGGAGGYEYFRLYPLTAGEGGTYTYTVAKDDVRSITADEFAAKKDSNGYVIEEIPEDSGDYYIEIPWTEGYPGASYNQANGVTWDLSTVPVQPGVTYRLKFKVWPSQEAYDTIADLNNGLITMTDEELQAAGIGYHEGTGYYLLTNTHLKTTYSFKGETYEDVPSETPTSEMILPTTPISVKKTWNNNLDARQAQGVTLTVTKDKNAYKDIEMGTPVETVPGKQWTQEPNKDIYISMGQLTLDSATNTIDVISSGHDYTIIEPESFSYNWELTADIYHPMVINGTPTVLVEVSKDQKASLPDAVKNLEQNKHISNGGNEYYAFNNELYVAKSGKNVLTATNDRRSNLNLTKKIEAADDIQVPEDGLFTYSIKITYPERVKDDVWFSIQDEDNSYILNGDFDVNDYVSGAEEEEIKTMDSSYTNVVFHEADDTHHYDYYTYTRYGENLHARAADDGSGATHKIRTGFYHAKDATEFTLKIRAGWNVRFTNMPNDTQYEFIETAQDDGYVFKTAESVVDRDGTPGTLEEGTAKVTGTIDKPNNTYTATFTNEFLGFFYVYHSSDLSVERFPMAKDGVKVESFDIYAETLEGTLYGGYYSDYVGKSEGFDAAALTYTDGISSDDAEKAHAYDLAYIKESGKAAWSADAQLKTIGTAMKPELNQVYYLKEVPVAYLQPYTYYTYYKADNKIANMWAISDLDDLNYADAGFYIIDEQKNATSVVSSLSIKADHSKTAVTLNAFKLFNTKHGVKDGFLSYWKFTDDLVGSQVTVKQYWVTPDGIEVLGTMMRTMDTSGDHCYKGQIVSSDTAVKP